MGEGRVELYRSQQRIRRYNPYDERCLRVMAIFTERVFNPMLYFLLSGGDLIDERRLLLWLRYG